MRRLRRISPVTWGVVGLLLALAACNVFTSTEIPSGTGLKGVGIITLPFAAVGLVVARRRPRNSIGWILLALAFSVLVSVNAANYAVLVYRVHDGLPFGSLAVLLAPAWVPILLLLPLPIVLFPDGRIPRGRWRWVFRAYVAVVAVFLVEFCALELEGVTHRHVAINSKGWLDSLNGPNSAVGAALNTAEIIAYGACFLAMVVYQVMRFRRAGGDERQQLKWFLACGAVAGGGLIVASQSNALGFLFVCVVFLPLGIGFGILKYRLYDIDRLISRTLSYAIVTATLVAVFAGTVLLTTRVLPFSSPVGVAASTLAAAALFNPLRGRVQRLVDRRFNRARYDAEATVAAFGARLRNAVDVETVLDELASAAAGSLEPAHVTVWVRSAP
jgi:hypothetical protein